MLVTLLFSDVTVCLPATASREKYSGWSLENCCVVMSNARVSSSNTETFVTIQLFCFFFWYKIVEHFQ